MDNTSAKPKSNRKVLIYRGLALFFLAMQLLGYLGNSGSGDTTARNTAGTIAYQIGYHFALWLAILFFLLSIKAKKKIEMDAKRDQINSIGQD